MSDRATLKPLTPDLFEKCLALGAAIILAAVVTAIVKGRAEWGEIPLRLWGHLATICLALILTPVMLLRKRGDPLHRQLGWLWASAMFLTALVTLFIRGANHGGFSVIHILSVFTLTQVPLIVWSAKTHNIVRHRRSVRAMVLGALLIAGFFTFPFDRLMGHWLFS
jgi:uncharacterized membrane protein